MRRTGGAERLTGRPRPKPTIKLTPRLADSRVSAAERIRANRLCGIAPPAKAQMPAKRNTRSTWLSDLFKTYAKIADLKANGPPFPPFVNPCIAAAKAMNVHSGG
jgi:hypothetical protein